jgi:crotonobetainyl-CoA:carnitine CoA-transferase CaiB-like acyl-CoA transferase
MSTTKPLAGLKVLEIGHSIAAPYAGMILGELGADVIKLENPGAGDYCRGWGPPFSNGAATMFQSMNRAKRGITADLRDERMVARVRTLVIDEMDVILHNLKPGALDRLGLGAESLLADKPGLIFCEMGAFGHVGPLRDLPGYDPLMQAFGGLMSMLGEEGRPPVRVPVSIMDLATGMWTVIGILAAHAERVRTGIGGRVDTSLFETSCAWMGIPLANHIVNGTLPKRAGSGVTEIVPYQVFPTANSFLMVAAGNDNLFAKLCSALDRPDLGADPRFTTNAGRVSHRADLINGLLETFATGTTETWSVRLTAVGIPNGPVQTLDQVVAHPQTEALGILQTSPDGTLRNVGLPLSFDGKRPAFEKNAPSLGEDNAAILGTSQ